MILGYIGSGLLVFAYLILISRYSKLFIPINILACIILTTYAFILKDIPFIIVNGLVTVALTIKYFKGGIK